MVLWVDVVRVKVVILSMYPSEHLSFLVVVAVGLVDVFSVCFEDQVANRVANRKLEEQVDVVSCEDTWFRWCHKGRST